MNNCDINRDINNEIENIQISKIFDLNSSIQEFKKEEFENILNESQKINNILISLQNEKDKIIHDENYDPKTIHLAHQHLSVIQNNLKEQLFELRLLIKNLESKNIVKLEENNSYMKMKENSLHFNHVFKIFLPYILICSIYLKFKLSTQL